MLLACVHALAAGAVGRSAAPLRTHVIRGVTPFTANGQLRPGLRVERTAPATCEPGSDSVPADDFRCFAGNLVLDPCWRDLRAQALWVVCLIRPWDTTVVRLRLRVDPGRSRRAEPRKGTEAWGIQTGSGMRCLAEQGAHDTVSGREGSPVVDYRCGGSLVLLRGIDASGRIWTIRSARYTHRLDHPYELLGRVRIATAWFGGNNPLKRKR
jgi:hypothetical protein